MTTVADFFAGLGGFTEGASQAGARTLFAANHWQEAIDWHEANHPDVEHVCQELGEMDKRIIPDVDLLVASPACHGWSPNGRPGRVARKVSIKHQADRNTAWAVVSACDTKRPRRVLVENVVEMRDEWGALYDAWVGCLEAMSYTVRTHVLNAQDFGTPQDRRRLIVTASLDGPIDIVTTTPRLPCIGDCLDATPQTKVHEIAAKTPSMRTRMREAQGRAGRVCFWSNVDSSRGRSLDEVFPTITTRLIGQAYLLDGDSCRMLSARELARAQGFPETYRIPPGRTLAGKLIGNAIPVPMARSIVEQVAAA